MGLGKIFKVFKKASKAVPGKKGGKGDDGKATWPPGIKIGFFGHANSGKTVYFTVLNEECKISKELQISVTDNITANEFLMNYRSLWGLGTAKDSGTMVDLKGEKKFPNPTSGEKFLQFTAILDQSKKLPVVICDYDGKAVSISENSESGSKVFDFMCECDGIIFLFDPKILAAELQTQAHVASFVNMLQRLVPLRARLPIPIALMVTKADVLPGFTGNNQSVLINPEEEHFISEDFDQFLEKILNANRILADSEWAGAVRNILIKLREFLRIVVGRTLNFQIFFVSGTGETPEKIGVDVGRSIYAPPPRINPVGVREPVYWLLKSIIRSRRISTFRKLAKFVAIISLIWILFFSLPFLYHFKFLLPRAVNVEEKILENHKNNVMSTTAIERDNITKAYKNYRAKWLVRQVFTDFVSPAGNIISAYGNFSLDKAIGRLDGLIADFARMLNDTKQWPGVNPSNDSLILKKPHEKLLSDLSELRGMDENSILFIRANRILNYWDLFSKYIVSRKDTAAGNSIIEQVNFDLNSGQQISLNEKQLGGVLLKVAQTGEKVVTRKVDSRAALMEFEDIKEKINNSDDPKYIFNTAVQNLRKIKVRLNSAKDGEQIGKIDKYLKDVKKWSKRQKFIYKLDAVPDNGHLHIEVTSDGSDPTWAVEDQFFEGDEKELKWKFGDDIYIAFDEAKFDCKWGKVSSGRKVLNKGKYTLFEMDGDIALDIGKTISISFKPALKEMLPRIE